MNTIRMTSDQFKKLKSYLLSDVRESAAFLIAGFYRNSTGVHFAVRDILIPEEKDYDDRNRFHIQVSPLFFNKAISRAEASDITVIACHSHPFKGILQYSSSDNYGESLSSETLRACLYNRPMGSLLFGPDKVLGRAWIDNKKPVVIDQLRIVDRHLSICEMSNGRYPSFDSQIYDRQVRAFGMKGQAILSRLNVGIVGVGGTGSSVAEQLVREGVRRFVLVDHDKFEPSNKTRMYGSGAENKGEFKVDIVKKNLQKILPEVRVVTIPETIISQKTLAKLKDCDVVFSCSDRHAPRSVLNELAYQYFIPVIDIGTGLDAKDDRIEGGSVRASLVSPGLPCMYCYGIINSETILAESLSKEERQKRQKEGYVSGMDDDAPSVVTFTTMAATFGLMLFKDLLFGYMDTRAGTIMLDIKSFESSRLAVPIKTDCVCTARTGKGDYLPLSAP